MADEKMTLGDAKEKIEELKTRAKNFAAKADHVIDRVVTATVTMGAAGGLGLVEGYNGEDLKIGGADGAAVLSFGAHALALTNESKYSEQIAAAGNGWGAVWLHRTMVRVGKKMKENKTAGKPMLGNQQPAGQMGAGGPQGGYGEQGISPWQRAAE